MPQDFQPGDFLIFQLEAGYGLLRFLGSTSRNGEAVWHVAAYDNLFLDPNSAEDYIDQGNALTLASPHVALTTRAFESTQVARLSYKPLSETELSKIDRWNSLTDAAPSDRSIRLLLGLR